MTTSQESLPLDPLENDRTLKQGVDTSNQQEKRSNHLRHNALGFIAILCLCVAAIAPAASMLFNVPVMASEAGAAVPLAFLLSAIGIVLLGLPVINFASRVSSAGGFTTWVRHGFDRKGPAFLAGWLMLGAYALFEAALQATVGSSLDSSLSALGFHVPGGWMAYALLLIVVVCLLSYFDVKLSLWVMAPFAVAEVIGLIILNSAITLRGGTVGHDLVHTFTPAGATLQGAMPGGITGIGVAMTLGILAFVGFETGAVYGEEARNPKRSIPLAMYGLLIFLCILYIWTSYSAIIGFGWSHASDILGNVATAPAQYQALAGQYVGNWLGTALMILVVTSNFASAFAMHQAMVRYCYDLGREGLLPRVLGRTHNRWQSPYMATCAQSIFSVIVILFLGLIMQRTNQDGSITYAIGIADGTSYVQTGGVVSFQWLASVVTMCIIITYLLTNAATPFFAHRSGKVRLVPHVISPLLSSLFLLLPLASYILPALPGIGAWVTSLGFAATPFPTNILPLFVAVWIIIGIGYAQYLARKRPNCYARVGMVVDPDNSHETEGERRGVMCFSRREGDGLLNSFC